LLPAPENVLGLRPMKPFALKIPRDVAAQLQKCHASLRQSIKKRLREIADDQAAAPPTRGKVAALIGPPLRFYVSESCRVSYQVNPLTRSIEVLKLRADPV